MKKYIISKVFILCIASCTQAKFDVTVLSVLKFAESIARLPITFIDMLKDEIKINFIPTNPHVFLDYSDIQPNILTVLQHVDKSPGNIALFYDLSWFKHNIPLKHPILNSKIKIAYSMTESTAISDEWVGALNTYFDAVVVPDQFLVPVYENSGVKIPIFILPCPLYLDEFLEKPVKEKPNRIFNFGASALFVQRKNFERLIDAFALEFGSDPNVKLTLHMRGAVENNEKRVKSQIEKYGTGNMHLIEKSFKQSEYVDFLSSLDCYAFLSKGEGFSIIPREVLALGIPCILSDNTAHTTICKTGFVRAVPSLIKEPAYYEINKSYYGYHFNCTLADARKALRDVYDYYNYYLAKARQGKEWVKQYRYQALKFKYLNLIKPKKVILGSKNVIEEDYLITTSEALYNKYSSL